MFFTLEGKEKECPSGEIFREIYQERRRRGRLNFPECKRDTALAQTILKMGDLNDKYDNNQDYPDSIYHSP